MPTPKPATRGFFTDRSPPTVTKADQEFHALHKRYPNAIEAQLAPREGHPMEQTVIWSDCPLAKMYPQWEISLFESVKNRPRKLANLIKGVLGPEGPSAADIKSKCETRYPTDEL